MRDAVESRQLEFARGRAMARRALESAGGPAAPIPVRPNRAPAWPAGFVGSITHCDGLAAAAVAPSGMIRGIGIDAEPRRGLPPETRRLILRPGEFSEGDPIREMTVFCAKECVHKALYPITDVWLDFQDVEITLLPDGGIRAEMSPTATRDVPEVAELHGRYRVSDDFIVAALAW